MLYRILEMPGVDSFDLTKLNNLYYGAAPMSPAKLKQLQDRFGNIFIQAYASTENCAFALSLEKTAHLITKPEEQGRLASAGQVTPGCELRIVDDAGHAVAEGEVGEIWLRSRGTIVGYFDCPDLTAAEFTNGFWKSGDLARCDADGFVYIVDRKKDMIISGGFNIYAIEVEAAISSHAAVLMCAVVGIPHDDWGEAVHAEVVLRPDTKVEAQALIDHARDQLGHYKAPKTVSFVESLPVSAVGKVLRRDVRNKYWSGKERSIG
jgi:fatty-acyl-CoA synthase